MRSLVERLRRKIEAKQGEPAELVLTRIHNIFHRVSRETLGPEDEVITAIDSVWDWFGGKVSPVWKPIAHQIWHLSVRGNQRASTWLLEHDIDPSEVDDTAMAIYRGTRFG